MVSAEPGRPGFFHFEPEEGNTMPIDQSHEPLKLDATPRADLLRRAKAA